MIDDALRNAYRAARYVVSVGDSYITLEIDRPSPELDLLLAGCDVAAAAFVTAWNPGSVWFPEAENRLRANDLAAAVQNLGLKALPVTTTADDPRWVEQGLLILGISTTQARDLGEQFGQNAIVTVTRGDAPRLIERVSRDAAS